MRKLIWIIKKFARTASKWQSLVRYLGIPASEPAPVTTVFSWFLVLLIWLWAPLRKGEMRPWSTHLHSVTCLRCSFISGILLASVPYVICWQVRTFLIYLSRTSSSLTGSTSTTAEAVSRSVLTFLVDWPSGLVSGAGDHQSPFTAPHNLCTMLLPRSQDFIFLEKF